MDDRDRAKIAEVKSRVVSMLQERELLAGRDASVETASDLWSEICSRFGYLLGLSEEYYSDIRKHTYHLTSDRYEFYQTESLERRSRYRTLFGALTKGVPEEFKISEPDGGIGFSYDDGRVISKDILRFQRVVTTLHNRGVISALSADRLQRKACVLEIGSGYGGLAHHLSRLIGGPTYVVVDLPETLLFSASYLTLLNPDKQVYLYGKSDFSDLISPETVDSFDFILVPNYALQSLRDLRFDLAINVTSFQEMRTAQVEEYLDFIVQTSAGPLYSLNDDWYAYNQELTSLSSLLRTRFEITEVVEMEKEIHPSPSMRIRLGGAVKRVAVLAGLLNRPEKVPKQPPTGEFICMPLGGELGV